MTLVLTFSDKAHKIKRGVTPMRNDIIKTLGLAAACFSLGVIVQIFLPDIYITLIFACILFAIGVLVIAKC